MSICSKTENPQVEVETTLTSRGCLVLDFPLLTSVDLQDDLKQGIKIFQLRTLLRQKGFQSILAKLDFDSFTYSNSVKGLNDFLPKVDGDDFAIAEIGDDHLNVWLIYCKKELGINYRDLDEVSFFILKTFRSFYKKKGYIPYPRNIMQMAGYSVKQIKKHFALEYDDVLRLTGIPQKWILSRLNP